MKCSNCSSEIVKTDARFCPECGLTLDVSGFQALAASTEKYGENLSPPKALSKRSKLILIILGIVVVLLAALASVAYFFNPFKPDNTANEFLGALQSEQYEKAYSYFDDSDFVGEKYLNLESFKAAFGNKKMLDYKLKMPSITLDDYLLPVTADVVSSLGGDRKELKLTLVNKGNKYMPKWKIQPGSFEVKSNVSTLSGIKVSINGNEVPLDRGKASIPMFMNFPVKAEFSSPDVKAIQINGVAGDNLSVTTFQPNDQLKDQLVALITSYNKEWIKAVDSLNSSNVSPYLKPNTKPINDLDNYINQLKQSSYKEGHTLKDIKFGMPVFGTGFDRVSIDTNETWSVDIKDSTGKSVRTEERLLSWKYTLEKQSDNKWVIVETNKK